MTGVKAESHKRKYVTRRELPKRIKMERDRAVDEFADVMPLDTEEIDKIIEPTSTNTTDNINSDDDIQLCSTSNIVGGMETRQLYPHLH